MGIVHAPDSEYAKEMSKWEAQATPLGVGKRPYVKYEWPSRVYLAAALNSGGIEIIDEDTAVSATDFISRFQARGYRLTPLEAIDHLKAQQTEFATLAAEREYEKRHRLSPKARAEVEQVEEAAGATHLPTIAESPAKPVRKGGWPKGMSRAELAKRRAQEST